MSKKTFSVAYDGDSRGDDHAIDVDVLAPALLAFGRLIREANHEINGSAVKAQVLVVSDFEHKCFNINFELVLHYYDQFRLFVGLKEVKDAKEILEWLDLITAGSISVLGYLGFLRIRKGRKIEEVSQIIDSDETGTVAVRFEGDQNKVVINNHTWNLANNPKALAAARDALSPIGSDAFERMIVRDGQSIVGKIEANEADDIRKSCASGIEEARRLEPFIEETTAWLTVYSPVYEAKVESWRFRLGRQVIHADISKTTIAKDAIARGGAMIDDTYQVRLEIETSRYKNGKLKKPIYRVLKVLHFIPA